MRRNGRSAGWSWRDLPIGRKALIVIAIPVLPLIVTAGLYFRSLGGYDAAQEASERATRNRLLQAQVFSLVLEAESLVRGQLLVTDATFERQYADAVAEIRARLGALASSTTDPEQREHLPLVSELVASRLEALDAALASRARGGLDSEELALHVTRGAEVMRALRREMARIEQIQARVLVERADRLRDVQAQSNAIVLAGSVAGVLGGLAAALLFTTGITRRLALATQNMSRLARHEPLLPGEAGADEIGTLSAGTARAAQLLEDRDRQLAQRMEELESLTRELEAFSYSVSHDLRAPLRHIAGFATMLQKSAGSSLTDQQRRHITVIVEAAARMGNLIDDLLAFSRTSRIELRQVPVDVTGIVHDVRQQLMAQANGRNVRWVVHPLPRVTGDPALLRVVFDNLLANAVKYTRPRAQAEIEVGTRDGGDGEAIVYVRDNGVGFDMQYQNKLFGVFQRLHSSDDFEGTGIGLATVRRIVARHGGRAWAEGRSGEGATFYVSLPREENAA